MNVSIRLLAIILFELLQCNFINSQNNANDCEYDLKDGSKYNFSKLRKQTGDYDYVFNRYTYKANFCGPLNTKCITSPNTPAALFLRGIILIKIRYILYYKIHS